MSEEATSCRELFTVQAVREHISPGIAVWFTRLMPEPD